MCGRTACTLTKEQLQKACCQYDSTRKKFTTADWVDEPNGGKTYKPSYNVCPSDVTPVIVEEHGLKLLKPMVWGMIPPWHKGNFNDHKLATNNARLESIMESKLYKEPLRNGNRCVVVCDGFYEWQTTKGKKDKQPYFIYSPQPPGIRIDDSNSWSDKFTEENGWSGPRLLHMAALYNTWTSRDGEKFLSYSIITTESDSFFGWLHNRVPVILGTEDSIRTWLNRDVFEVKAFLHEMLSPSQSLQWHPVSSAVNNSRNKSLGLNRAVTLKEAKAHQPTPLDKWLNRVKRKGDDDSQNNDKKKMKHEGEI